MISCLESPAWQFEIISHHSILDAPFSRCHTLCYVLVTRLCHTWTILVVDQRRSVPEQIAWSFPFPLDIPLEHLLQKSRGATLLHLWSKAKNIKIPNASNRNVAGMYFSWDLDKCETQFFNLKITDSIFPFSIYGK